MLDNKFRENAWHAMITWLLWNALAFQNYGEVQVDNMLPFPVI